VTRGVHRHLREKCCAGPIGRAARAALLGALLGVALEAPCAKASAADVAVASSPGAAVPKIPVRIDSASCDESEMREIVAILRVELGAQLAGPLPGGEAYGVGIACSPDEVAVSLSAPARPTKTYTTSLRGAPPNVRARIVAITLAEAVRDLDRESESGAERLLPNAEADAHLATREPAPAGRSGAVQLGALGQASAFRNGGWLLGGGLRVEYRRDWVRCGIDAIVMTSAVDEGFTLGTAHALLSYGGLYAGWGGAMGRFLGQLGGGYALGMARLAGKASEPGSAAGSVQGVWAAPYAFGSLAWTISANFQIELRAQIGWVTSPVVGEVQGDRSFDLGSPWSTLQLAAAIAL
jgi:hypothetical protein